LSYESNHSECFYPSMLPTVSSAWQLAYHSHNLNKNGYYAVNVKMEEIFSLLLNTKQRYNGLGFEFDTDFKI